MCASVHRNAPMNFSAQGVLSFYWIPSYAITPQRLTCREVGSGVVWNLGSSQALGSQGWRLGFCLHCLIFPVILAQSFLISDARDLLRPSVGLCCSTVWFYFPIFYSRSDPLMFLLIKASFSLSFVSTPATAPEDTLPSLESSWPWTALEQKVSHPLWVLIHSGPRQETWVLIPALLLMSWVTSGKSCPHLGSISASLK